MPSSQILSLFPNEFIIIGIIAVVLLFGATKLPSLARSIGRSAGEYKKGRQEIEKELEQGVGDEDREKLENAAKALGIDPIGKSIGELKDEIRQRTL
ncbi:MAG: twin-arginine translocase TatA/TatE family subunit [Thaumarchaeota archaeon]|nr:twin-arginine translocase TatA/TatE family subunit [Nitrososphaerota archaeon]